MVQRLHVLLILIIQLLTQGLITKILMDTTITDKM